MGSQNTNPSAKALHREARDRRDIFGDSAPLRRSGTAAVNSLNGLTLCSSATGFEDYAEAGQSCFRLAKLGGVKAFDP